MTVHIISGQSLIATYFNEHQEKDSVDMKDIFEFKNKIRQELEKSNIVVYIDYTKDAIINTINNNFDIFKRSSHEGKLYCINRKKLQQEIIWYFNALIPHEIKEKYTQAVKQILEQEKKG